ncbi:MAG: agmatine deiminase family protein [Caulobacteraceae bacterium]|nr:agmatine deiminase family protein [Caulobacteraceae bacterium]
MSVHVPAEWSPHRAMWLGFPSHGELWEDDMEPAQAEVAALARALAGPGGERVRLMVCGEAALAQAKARLEGVRGVEFVQSQFGDIWLRDTGPLFLAGEREAPAAGFRFNGWGGKYVLDDDDLVAEQIAAAGGVPLRRHDFVVEGGALDHDGFGAVLTTRQCLLNPNRNPGWTEATAEAALGEALGVRRVLWLDDGLLNDHTDGHVDNLARFVAPGVVACPVAYGRDDPNAAVYTEVARALAGMRGPRGAPLQVARIASPGRVVDADGEIAPASHMNFIIANKAVIAPIYDDAAGSLAVDALRGLFPERAVIGLSAKAILTGGGSFHCITQQEPA